MSDFVTGPVRVSVPATSANLGPGFDSLGLALALRDELEGEVRPEGLSVEVTGPGAGLVALDEGHLVVRAMRAAFAELGASPPGLRLTCRNVIPHGRGLGSSSAAIVGGLVLARAMVAGGAADWSDAELLDLAVRLEGHPDNVAPALVGGFTIAGRDEHGKVFAVRAEVQTHVGAVAFVPPEPVATEVARGLLPASVPHADAAAGAGRAALLVVALTGRPDQLWRATHDVLHQDYRRPAMPQSLALVDELRADGVAAVVSGAGPTVLALVEGPDPALERRCPQGWECLPLALDTEGARVG